MNKSSFVKTMFVRYGADLKRFVAHKFGDPDNADDIVQDAFHNFLKTEAPEEIENPRAYLYQTAHNLALNRIRKQRNHENYLAQEHIEEDQRSPERTISAGKDLEMVHKALETLPEKCRQAFIMSRLQNRTYTEIADELSVSVSSVEKYLIRSINFLRDSFDGLL